MIEVAEIRTKNEIEVEDGAEGWEEPADRQKAPAALDLRRRPCVNRVSGVRRRAP